MMRQVAAGFLALALLIHTTQGYHEKPCVTTDPRDPNYTGTNDPRYNWVPDVRTENMMPSAPMDYTPSQPMDYAPIAQSGNPALYQPNIPVPIEPFYIPQVPGSAWQPDAMSQTPSMPVDPTIPVDPLTPINPLTPVEPIDPFFENAQGSSCTSVYDTLVANNFTRLVSAITRTGLTPAFQDTELVATVFAPTDTAFDMYCMSQNMLPDVCIASMDLYKLLFLLRTHIVGERAWNSGLFTTGTVLTAASGKSLTVTVDAFTKVVSLKADSVTNSWVVPPFDLIACKSIIHAINYPIVSIESVSPPLPPQPSPPAPPPSPRAYELSIPAALAMNPDLSSITALLKTIDLWNNTDVQSGAFVGTLFLPNNAAVQAFMMMRSITNAANLTKEKTTELLTYHIVPGISTPSNFFSNGVVLSTLLYNRTLTIQRPADGSLLVLGSSAVPAAVIDYNNGAGSALYHIINRVLEPAGF